MVTASNVLNRFQNSSVMSESYIEKYIRAKRRHEADPKCLFGTPSDTEVNRYISEQNAEQMSSNQEILEKYDLTDVPTADLLLDDSHSTTTEETEESTPSSSSFSSNDSGTETRFHPRVITRNNPAPAKNLFTPIHKVEVSSSSRGSRTGLSEYWQTPKRRRASADKKMNIPTTSTIAEDSAGPSTSGCSSQGVFEKKSQKKIEGIEKKRVKK